MKRVFILFFLSIVIPMTSCGVLPDHKPATIAIESSSELAPPPPKPHKDIEDGLASSGQYAVVKASSILRTRMVIKTGELAIEVEKYDDGAAELQKFVEQWGGFVSSSTTEIPFENVRTGIWVLRMPSEKFELALSEIKKLARKLEKESVEGQDVTEEFYDLEARLQNKLLEEKQVRDILRRAGTIHDVLEVQRELSNIREQIERFEGRKKFLMDQTGLSTITVRLHEAYPIAVSSSGGFWATIGSGFSNGFRGFANVLGGTITFLIAGLPVFALIAVILWLLMRAFRRIRAKKSAI